MYWNLLFGEWIGYDEIHYSRVEYIGQFIDVVVKNSDNNASGGLLNDNHNDRKSFYVTLFL